MPVTFAIMFTGIIETTGQIVSIEKEGTNAILWIKSNISSTLKIDQSVSHNGICLTVEEVKENMHRVTAIKETLQKTNLNQCKPGDFVNLERCLILNDRLDGHLVQGHVDTIAICTEIKAENGSWRYRFQFASHFAPLVIDKGSVCINGISLTLFDVHTDAFSVAIIPYTYLHTNIKETKCSDTVNIEFDVVGKYIVRSLALSGHQHK